MNRIVAIKLSLILSGAYLIIYDKQSIIADPYVVIHELYMISLARPLSLYLFLSLSLSLSLYICGC